MHLLTNTHTCTYLPTHAHIGQFKQIQLELSALQAMVLTAFAQGQVGHRLSYERLSTFIGVEVREGQGELRLRLRSGLELGLGVRVEVGAG